MTYREMSRECQVTTACKCDALAEENEALTKHVEDLQDALHDLMAEHEVPLSDYYKELLIR